MTPNQRDALSLQDYTFLLWRWNAMNIPPIDALNRAPATQSRGFTLVELLVVLAVMTMLVSLLLPALDQGRKVARVAQCSALLHQNGVAHNSYQVDFKNYFPLFGGASGYDASQPTIYESASVTPWWHNVQPTYPGQGTFYYGAALNYFTDYLNCGLASGTDINKQYSMARAAYCPTVNWLNLTYAISNRSYYSYGFGQAVGVYSSSGYSYWTGRVYVHPTLTSFNLDTRPRREDNREVIMTDLVAKNAGINSAAVPAWYQAQANAAIPWFNPHESGGCTVTRGGKANQLTADGAVASFDFSQALLVQQYAIHEQSFANATIKGPGTPVNGNVYLVAK